MFRGRVLEAKLNTRRRLADYRAQFRGAQLPANKRGKAKASGPA